MAKARRTPVAASGGKFPGVDPVFFQDRQRVAVVCALAVKIFHLGTRQAIAKISCDGLEVSQLRLTDDESKFHIVKNNGSLEVADVAANDFQRIFADRRILRVLSDDLDVLVEGPDGISLGRITEGKFEPLKTLGQADIWAFSPSRQYIAWAHGHIFYTWDCKTNTIKELKRDRKAHICAISDQGLLAVGGTSGVIDVYYGQKSIRTLKWHLEAISALRFSLNGEYLISGGAERVLVFWQMETNKQQFLPRLDGPITSIVTNSTSTLYGVTLGTGQVVILSAVDLVSRLQVSGVRVHYAKIPDKKKRKVAGDYTAHMRFNPSSRLVYFLSGNSQVQVYNSVRDEQDSMLALAPSLPIGKVRSERDLVEPEATHLEFTSNGTSMATADKDGDRYNLKFWRQNTSGGWHLETRVQDPHGKGKPLICLQPHPHEEIFTSASNDGEVRLWQYRGHKWMMRRILSGFALHTSAVSLAWSPDASVLALGFDTSVYLVDPKLFAVIHRLPNFLGGRVRRLIFGGGPWLVGLSKNRLSVWDLVQAKQHWGIALPSPAHGGRLIAVDPTTQRLALAVNHWTTAMVVQSRIVVFDLKTPIPVDFMTHQQAVGAIERVPSTQTFAFVDLMGVIRYIGAAEKPQPTTETLHGKLVNLSERVPPAPVRIDVDEQPPLLDINTFSNLFESTTNLEGLFDRVMTLVSPPK